MLQNIQKSGSLKSEELELQKSSAAQKPQGCAGVSDEGTKVEGRSNAEEIRSAG